jgi:hypothetical protein
LTQRNMRAPCPRERIHPLYRGGWVGCCKSQTPRAKGRGCWAITGGEQQQKQQGGGGYGGPPAKQAAGESAAWRAGPARSRRHRYTHPGPRTVPKQHRQGGPGSETGAASRRARHATRQTPPGGMGESAGPSPRAASPIPPTSAPFPQCPGSSQRTPPQHAACEQEKPVPRGRAKGA